MLTETAGTTKKLERYEDKARQACKGRKATEQNNIVPRQLRGLLRLGKRSGDRGFGYAQHLLPEALGHRQGGAGTEENAFCIKGSVKLLSKIRSESQYPIVAC